MNICFITDDLKPCPSGIAVFSENVVRHLRDGGHRVTVFGPKDCPTADHQLPTFHLNKWYPNTDAFWVFPNWTLLKKVIFEKYDVIHINCPAGLTGFAVCLIAAIRKIKVVFYNHGNVNTWCKFHNEPPLSSLISRYLYYIPQILFKPVIIQNPGCEDLDHFKRKFQTQEGACGIDLNLFPFSPVFEKYHLVSAGRLSKEKNWIRLLQLFSCLPKHYKLSIIGGGGQENELKKFCLERGLDNVHFVGRIPQEELSTYLQNAQAYVSASLFETWGLTLTEALACGTPLVYPNHKAFTTLYQKAFPEGLYQIDQEQSFIDAVLQTENTNSASREKCHKYAQQFSWENATRKLVDIYESCTKTI